MTKRFLLFAVCALVGAALTAAAPAQEGERPRRGAPDPRLSGPVPMLPDGTVDLIGAWTGGGPVQDMEVQGKFKPGEIPLLPWAKKLMDSRKPDDDPHAHCMPMGVPRQAGGYPWRFIQYRNTHIFILWEANIHSYRQIFMDGRKHPDDLDPTWYGHSIGRFEGKTLVVDTIGYNDKTWFDFKGNPHTEQLHTVERYSFDAAGKLVNEVTIEDPGAYEKPFKVTFTAERAPKGFELMEYICQENNQDVEHLRGPTTVGGDPARPQGTLGQK